MPANKETYRKSLLFEIVSKRNRSKAVSSFVLNIPPESIEIEEPHRVRTTKTFGGVFVDDYGPDTLSISISGNTGGRSEVNTLINDSLVEMNGKAAFYRFRDTMMRYKNRIPNYADYEMILYDLSTTSAERVDIRQLNDVLSEGYVVILKKFKMRRSKEKPFFYNYTIELEGVRSLGTYTGEITPPVVTYDPSSRLVNIRKCINSIKAFFYKVDAMKNQVDSFFDLIDQTAEQVDAFAQKSVDIVFYPLELCKRLFASANTILDSVQSISDTVRVGILKRSEKESYEMTAIVEEMCHSVAALVTFGKTPEASGNVAIKDITEPSKTKALDTRYENLTEEEAQVDSWFMPVDVTSSEDVVAYGYILVVPDATTTLEKLASEYYNNPALLTVIAAFNGFEGDEDIVVGVPIRIPVLEQGGIVIGNYVYTEIVNDIYGADLRLDASGNIVVSGSGDLASLEGQDNLVQALNLRLNESLGSRLRLTVYGIRNTVGGAMANSSPIAYITTNIKDTVMQDPRVSDVYSMRIRGHEDVLDISFNVETIKANEVIPFVGGV